MYSKPLRRGGRDTENETVATGVPELIWRAQKDPAYVWSPQSALCSGNPSDDMSVIRYGAGTLTATNTYVKIEVGMRDPMRYNVVVVFVTTTQSAFT
jgi:hypothetical protein